MVEILFYELTNLHEDRASLKTNMKYMQLTYYFSENKGEVVKNSGKVHKKLVMNFLITRLLSS